MLLFSLIFFQNKELQSTFLIVKLNSHRLYWYWSYSVQQLHNLHLTVFSIVLYRINSDEITAHFLLLQKLNVILPGNISCLGNFLKCETIFLEVKNWSKNQNVSIIFFITRQQLQPLYDIKICSFFIDFWSLCSKYFSLHFIY